MFLAYGPTIKQIYTFAVFNSDFVVQSILICNGLFVNALGSF